MKKTIWALALLTILLSLNVSANTITYIPNASGIDTRIESGNPKNNFGAGVQITIGNYNNYVERGLIKINWTNAGLLTTNVSSIDSLNITLCNQNKGSLVPSIINVSLHQMFTCWEEGTKDNSAGNSSWYWNSTLGARLWSGGTAGTDFNATAILNATVSSTAGTCFNLSVPASIINSMFSGTRPDCGFMVREPRLEVIGSGEYNVNLDTSDSVTRNQSIRYVIGYTTTPAEGRSYNLSLMLTDLWDNSYITNFSVTVGGVTKGTTNGLIQYNLTNGTYAVTYNNVGNSTFVAMGGSTNYDILPSNINYVVAGETNKTNTSWQNKVFVTARNKISNASTSYYNSTTNTTIGKMYNETKDPSTGVTLKFPHSGAIQIWGNKSGFYPSDNISFTASKSIYYKNLDFPFSRLNISARDAITGTYLNTFTATLNTSGYGETFAATTGHVYAYIGNGTYTLTVTAGTYSTAVSIVTINATAQNTTALLYQSGSANINVYDEETGNLFLKNTSISFISTGYAQNYSTANGTLYMPNLTTGDYTTLYSSTGYGTRRQYITLTGTGAITANLYLLNSTLSNSILARVSDQNGDYLEGTTIQLLRYYISSNSYKTVAMIKTDNLGYGGLDVKLNDPTYQFLLQYEGETVYSTIGSPIWNTNTQEFQINTIEDFLYSLKNIDQVYTSLYYDNITGEFVYTFADNQGLLRSGCLTVISRGTTGDTIICDNCENSTAATITCLADTTKTLYIATAYVDTNTNYSVHIRDVLSHFTSFTTPIYAEQGVFYSFMIIAVMAMLGIWNPVVSILLGLMGLLLSVWLEFLSFGAATYTIVVGLIIVGLIAMLKIEG